MKLEEIEKLCQSATPAPWGWDWANDGFKNPNLWRAMCPMVTSLQQAHKDCEFIAAARTLMPKLLAVAQAAKELAEDEFSANYYPLFKALEDLEKE